MNDQEGIKAMKHFYFLAIFSTLLLTGCNGGYHTEFTIVEEKETENENYKPTLKVEVKTNGTKAIFVIGTNLIVSGEHYGHEKVNGEGHIHLYLDHGEKQGVTSSPYIIENVSKGKHEVRISLHNNDHTPYGVSETIEFEIK
ncbi:hypothetical protein ACOI1C_10225 [Bacillus sp. DJP31]|uniref:hypothetical protein n=1 Tax=Bacillus sp. DJP31 TaxID=3409789 RepID=UPI003BB52F04